MRPYAEYKPKIVTDRKTGEKREEPNGAYHPFAWRGWWDFGTGALGDMACHTANMAFRALKLGYPSSVVADATDLNNETCPSSAKVMYQFPARDEMPPVTLTWYEGRRDGQKLLPPQELVEKAISIDQNPKHKGKLVESGSILVGKKGMLYSPDDYGAQFYLYPANDFHGVNKHKPEKLPINGKGDTGMKIEWVEAIKGGPPAYSNFDFAAMLTETILLGNVAIRMNGQTLDWNGPELKFTNNSQANGFLHYDYRNGYTL
jgi:predicted dehydrogenase